MEDGQQYLLRSLHLLLATPFCLHSSFEQNINFVHEISHVKYIKRIDKNFSHELFGIEINENKNKANYSTYITKELLTRYVV